MTEMNDVELKEFDNAASNYRSWPAHDIAGVAARFAELVALVNQMIDSHASEEAELSREHAERNAWRDE